MEFYFNNNKKIVLFALNNMINQIILRNNDLMKIIL